MDPNLTAVLVAIFAPALCGAASLLVPRPALGARMVVAIAGPVLAIGALAYILAAHGFDRPTTVAVAWMPAFELDLAFNADRLGMFFALLVSVIGLLITLYARAYFGPSRDVLYRFFPALHLFMTAMIGVTLSDSFMLLLLFWEMMSISSFLLIGWERDKPESVRKAMQAFVVTGAGGLVMMTGLILLGVHTRVWTFTGLLELNAMGNLRADTLTVMSFVMIFIGAAAKSAQVPFHFWLPGAMAAPTPVSAYLHSATMVKAGVYLTGRMWPIFAGVIPLWPQLIVPIGTVTMVYGAFIALQKTDLKQIFAYTTVSQLGLLMTMYGLAGLEFNGQPNLIWDVTQVLNHALYKAPLFILAGAIGHVASRQLPELRGLFFRGRTERIMTVVILLAAYALAAGPLTISFTAKEMFFYQIYHALEATHNNWFWLLVAAGVATGMFNVAIFVRMTSTMLSRKRPEAHDEHERIHGRREHESGIWPAFLWIPGMLLVAFQFIGGIVPGAYVLLFGTLDPSKRFYNFGHEAHAYFFPMTWHAQWGLPLQMSLCAIGLGLLLGLAPVLRRVYNDPFDRVYPGFYALCTKGGGRLFGWLQSGNAGVYVTCVFVAMIGLFAGSIGFDFGSLGAKWTASISIAADVGTQLERAELRTGALLTALVCLSALLMPIVKDRAARVLMLGTCGFSVTAVYYLYKAPDLALTQVSIEIVSLIMFLLVLSLLPTANAGRQVWVAPRLIIAGAVGAIAFWLTLTSSVGARPTMPYLTAQHKPVAHLGEYFLRNSHHAQDTTRIPAGEVYGGVVDRGAAHLTSFGTGGHDDAGHEGAIEPTVATRGPMQTLHKGGGGRNVVNVILVDFRGFDTMGEITVLGIAAIGVWTLLRRSRHLAQGSGTRTDFDKSSNSSTGLDQSPYTGIDISKSTDGIDPEDSVLRPATQGSTQS